jgi:molecular chaperone DnaJ
VRFQQGLFPIAVERPCAHCRGTGKSPKSPCTDCKGQGLSTKLRTIQVTIPAGIEAGSSRIVQGGGNRLRPDRAPGELEIIVDVAPHPFFQRSGDDVVCSVPITFAQAALGGEIEVPTLEGKVKLRVPPSTQPGTVLRVKGKGIPHRVRAGRGDQLVEVTLEVPTKLNGRARDLIEELGKELGEDVQPQQRTFVEKLKNLFG